MVTPAQKVAGAPYTKYDLKHVSKFSLAEQNRRNDRFKSAIRLLRFCALCRDENT